MVPINQTVPEPDRSLIHPPPPMTEAEWSQNDNSEMMLEFVRTKATKRKLRLFAAACFRRFARLLPDSRQQMAIEMLENAAEEIELDRRIVYGVRQALPSSDDSFGGKCIGMDDPYIVALMLYRELVSSSTAHHATFAARGLADYVGERREQSRLIRCIFGPLPFRTISLAPALRTATVVSLAQTIYNDNAFERLPILADALEATGCGDADILDHCRQPKSHVRGCWAVDLILGNA
ncbi:MAG TPA: hypothetical protein VGM05_19095 [Planctomycetaceae bacterium]|jgi:hypothetical protein